MKNRIRMIFVLYLICLLPYSADAQAPVVADEDLAAGKLGRNIKIEQKGDNIYNIEFRNADIKDIMRFFAREYGLNIIADKDIEGTVTASLGNITIRQALKQILDSQNFTMIETDNVIRVRTKPSAVVTFKINNVSAADIRDNLISLLSSTGKMVIDSASNSIMVTDQDDNIRMIQSFLESVDKKGRQVLIEARFVETSLVAAKSLGIEWGTTITARGSARPHTFPFGSVGEKYMLGNEDAQAGETDRTNIAGFPVAGDELYKFGTLDFSQFQAVLKALLTDQNTRVISNPKVATINNRAATMGVTTEYPLPTYEVNKDTGELNVSGYEYKDVGITLNVTPFITTDNYITMTIEPKVGAVGDTVTVGTTGFELPIISSKTATTKVTIKNGETIVIGGLISDGEVKTVKKVPLLGSLPIIGKVFSSEVSSKSSSELLIFVTPHIINLEGENELKKQKIDAMYREIDRLSLEGNDRGVISKAGEILKLDGNEQRAMSLIEKAADRKIRLQNEQTNQNVDEQAQLSQSLLKESNQFYAKRDYESARDKYIQVLSVDPENQSAINMLKRSEDKIGLTLNKRVSDLLLSAERAFRRKDYAQALDGYNQVLALDPGNRKAESGIDELNQYIRQEEYLLRLDSELNRAVTLRNQGEYRQAVSVLDGILEKDSGNRQARELKASCLDGIKKEDILSGLWREANRLYADKDYESALVKYSEILALNPGNSSALDMLNRCEDSIEIAKNKNIASLLTMGEKAKRNGDYNLAIDYFQKVLELDPGNKEARGKISDIKFQSSPAVSAPEVAKVSEIPKPKPVDKNLELKVLWEEANNLYAGGDYAGALSRYNDIVSLQPSDQVAAQMARKCRDKIEQAQLRGSGSSTLFSQGLDKYNRADYAGAADIFEQILILDPANDRAYEYLDKSYSKMRAGEDSKIIPAPELKQSTSLDTYYRSQDLAQEPVSSQDLSGAEIAVIYREALNLYKNKKYYDALEKFRMISQIESRYQSLSQKKIEECLNKIEQPQTADSLEEKYQLALDYFKRDLYSQSIELLREVLESKPNYKDAKRYLNLSQERLKIINGLSEFEQADLGKNK